MGQKTNPIGNRLGFIRGWDSNWYGGKDYTDKLVEAHTTYGRIGIKCWICRGEVYGKRDLSPVPPQKKDRGDRRGGAPGRRRGPRS